MKFKDIREGIFDLASEELEDLELRGYEAEEISDGRYRVYWPAQPREIVGDRP